MQAWCVWASCLQSKRSEQGSSSGMVSRQMQQILEESVRPRILSTKRSAVPLPEDALRARPEALKRRE